MGMAQRSSEGSAAIALFLFHTRVGARLAARTAVPLFAALLAIIMLEMNPAAVMRWLGLALFGEPPSPGARAGVLAIALAIAAWGSPRLTHGLTGWLRHLPVSGAAHRRAAALGLLAAMTPLAAALLFLLIAAMDSGRPTHPAFLLHYLVLSFAAACAVLPVRRRLASLPLCVAAMALGLSPSPPAIAGAAALLIACDLVSGPIREPARRKPLEPAGTLLHFRIAWRALTWRLAAACLPALIPTVAAFFFVENNELTAGAASGAWRFGGALAVVLFLNRAGERLALRRPVWPWLRSLPLSSSRRVAIDAAFLGIHALLWPVLVAFRDHQAALAVLLLVPLLSLRTAAHMCRAPERKVALGPFLIEGWICAALLGLLAWTSVLWLLAVPPALVAASRADSRMKATRWRELHHAAAGDSLSWSS